VREEILMAMRAFRNGREPVRMVSRSSLAWRGALAVVIGVIAVIWPGITLGAFVILFAVYALLAAGVDTVRAFSSKRVAPPSDRTQHRSSRTAGTERPGPCGQGPGSGSGPYEVTVPVRCGSFQPGRTKWHVYPSG
jgi:hypothetical protein